MKLLFFLLLIPFIVFSQSITVNRTWYWNLSSAASESYDLRFTGDTSPDSSYISTQSGVGTIDGTCSGAIKINATYGEVGNGILIPSNNIYISWPLSGADTLDRNVGTIWFSIKTDVSEDFTADGYFFESYISSSNYLKLYIRSSDEKLSFVTKGGGVEETFPSLNAVNTGNWVRCAVTWTISTSKIAIYESIGAAWNEPSSSTYAKADSPFETFVLGENAAGGSFAHNIRVDNVYLINGSYEANDPYNP